MPIEIGGLIEGRAVHFVDVSTGEDRAATICKVFDRVTGCSNLQVLNVDRDGSTLEESIVYDPFTKAPGTWHFIEQV